MTDSKHTCSFCGGYVNKPHICVEMLTQQPKDKSGVLIEWVEATQEYAAYTEGPLGFKWMLFSVSPERARALYVKLGEVLGAKERCNCAAIHNVACIFWSKP